MTEPDDSYLSDGEYDDLAYVAKLGRTKRPRKLIGAIALLLLAMRRVTPEEVTNLRLRIALTVNVLAVARQLSAYVARQTGQLVPVQSIADELLAAIVQYAVKAGTGLTGNALKARLGLIVQAETQRATAAAFRTVAHSRARLVRTAQVGACDECKALAGTYSAPFPADVWWTHPRCSCTWGVA